MQVLRLGRRGDLAQDDHAFRYLRKQAKAPCGAFVVARNGFFGNLVFELGVIVALPAEVARSFVDGL